MSMPKQDPGSRERDAKLVWVTVSPPCARIIHLLLKSKVSLHHASARGLYFKQQWNIGGVSRVVQGQPRSGRACTGQNATPKNFLHDVFFLSISMRS